MSSNLSASHIKVTIEFIHLTFLGTYALTKQKNLFMLLLL